MPWSNTIKSLFGATDPTRYIKSAFWLTISKIASMAVSLIATFYIARTLGPQNFGEISYVISIIGVLGFLSAIASGNVLYRDIVRAHHNKNELLGTGWLVSLLASLFTITFVIVFIFAIPHDELTRNVALILCLAQFFTPFSIIQHTFYARTDTKKISLAQFIIHITISLAKIMAMASGNGVLILAVIMFLEQILVAATLSGLYIYTYKHTPLNWRFNFDYAKQLIKDSLPFVVVASSATISARIDQIIIKQFIDTTSVGLYQAAVQMTELWQFIPGLILTALYPAIVNAKNSSNYKKRLYGIGGTFLIYGFLASLFTTILAPILIPLIYGPAFTGSILILQIYCWSIAGTVLGFLVMHILVTENLRKIQIVTGVLPMLINLGLNLIWIPQYGMAGAAWATVVSYSLAPLLPMLYLTTTRRGLK